jgi:drug/metabolite transporter (DMT)-like permease
MLAPLYGGAVTGISTMIAADWGWLLFGAVGSTIVPWLLWFSAIDRVPANQAAGYLYLVPVCGVLWSAVILSDIPSAYAILGGVAVLAGVALTQTSQPRTSAVTAQAAPLEAPP